MLDNLIVFFVEYGYFAVFGVLILCGLGLPIPEDITLVAGGIISSLSCARETSILDALGTCHQVHVMFLVSMAGVLMGDSMMFFLGRFFGERILKTRFFSRLIPPPRYQWIQEKFEKFGVFFIFAARFMPGLRSPIFVVTGITKRVSYFKFLCVDGFAALISVPLWTYFGFWGERELSSFDLLEGYVKKGQVGIFMVLGVVFTITVVVWLVKKKLLKNKIPQTDIHLRKQTHKH